MNAQLILLLFPVPKFFPGKVTTYKATGNTIVRNYIINKRSLWAINGRASKTLTRIIEKTSEIYMASKIIQTLIFPPAVNAFIHKVFNMTPKFETIVPIAIANVEYKTNKKKISVKGTIKGLEGFLEKIYIMNELSANFLTNAKMNNELIPMPSAWNELINDEIEPILYNQKNAIAFYTHAFKCNPNVQFSKYWGTEKSSERCWAGFEYSIDLESLKRKKFSFKYEVKLTKRDKK